MAKSPLEAYRRQLPHWRLQGAVYSVNWRIHKNQFELNGPERSVVVAAIRHFEDARYDLHAYAVMNDHVHAILRPFIGYSLETIIHSWKSYSAYQLQHAFGRVGRVWQEEYFDKILRNKEHYYRLVRYVLQNPVRRWPGLQTYEWAGLGRAGEREVRIP